MLYEINDVSDDDLMNDVGFFVTPGKEYAM